MPSDWPLSYFASVYSQIATKPYVTPKHIVTEADISGMFSLFNSLSRLPNYSDEIDEVH